jgi:CRP-like cAMP-binding protein
MLESLLKSLSAFQDLTQERLRRLEDCLEEKSFGPNEVVFRQDDPFDGLYIVARGGVVIRSEVPGFPMERVRDVVPGELFGEMEATDSGRRLFAARTLGDTVVQRISQERVRELLEDPALEPLIRALVARRRGAARRAASTRGEPRIWLDRDVLVTLDEGETLRLRLENLSWSGACFGKAPDRWRVTQPLHFALGAGENGESPSLLRASGAVRWRQGRCAGVSFDGVGPVLRRRVAQALRKLASGPASG